MLTDADGPYSGRGTCKQQITNLQCTELTYISNNTIYPEEHIARIALLHGLAINIEMEINVLYIQELIYRNPIADSSRIIKTFA